ncbi:MAG TPA: 16S rRNA (guanine(527)-N(7))-methyltransferase RsmG [Bryobacteraceae bacterium]|jgi:16S rRNA (guanine(527)-N(7))-methyltransferase RsmG|nr:16S rRNA (guanine(527)-N(7))-methyltransferase RsmG [Bryobacteraceae bacterium]
MSEFRRHLGDFGEWSPTLSETQLALLEAHYDKLRFWMKKMNLTTITVPREMVLRHYVESLWFGGLIPEWVRSVADVGSGAGFPGVPVAILCSGCQVTLIEADRRKAIFLEESTLGLENIEVCAERLERCELSADAIITRAVDVGEVRQYAQTRAKWFGVLTSGEIADKFKWDSVEKLPWDQNHVAAFLKVSRGTS